MDSAFISNTGTSYGGGALFRGAAHITGARFTDNWAGRYGGGAVFDGASVVTDTQFVSNSADTTAGAHFAQAARVTDSAFTGNRASSWSAGATFVGRADLIGVRFINNTTAGSGGGAWFLGDTVVIQSQFEGNRAGLSGGGAVFAAGGVVTASVFANNHAGEDGGGAYLGDNRGEVALIPIRFANTLLAGNHAEGNGAAVYVFKAVSFDLIHATIVSPTVVENEAVSVHMGVVHITNTLIASHTVGIEQTDGVVTEDYNLFAGATLTTTGFINNGPHSREGDAAFADAAAGDYHITGHSAALNAGGDAGVATDFEGHARLQGMGRGIDIGYDELPQQVWFFPWVARE